MANEDVVSSFQFDVVLPEEVSFVAGSAVLTSRKSPYHILVAQEVDDNTVRFLSYAMPLGDFSGNDGDILTFDITLNGADGTYPIELVDVVISDNMGTIIPSSSEDGTITISGDVPLLNNLMFVLYVHQQYFLHFLFLK